MSQASLPSDSARSLEDRLDSAAEAWRPDVNDKLVGQIIDVDERETEFGRYPIVTVVTDSGDEVAVHGFHTVVKNEFAKHRPRVGEELGIKYLGKSDKGYEAYRIVWKDIAPVDWDTIGVEAAAEEAVETGYVPAGADADAEDEIPF